MVARMAAGRTAKLGARLGSWCQTYPGTSLFGVVLLWVAGPWLLATRTITALHHDIAWAQQAAALFLDGRVYEIGAMATEWPCLYWFHALTLLVGRVLGAAPSWTFFAATSLLLFTAAVQVERTLRRALEDKPLAAATTFALFAVSALAPGEGFGHHLALGLPLLLPYVCALLALLGGKTVAGRRVAGGLAALAIVLDVRMLLCWLALEIGSACRGKGTSWPGSRSARRLILGASVIALALLPVLAPGALRTLAGSWPLSPVLEPSSRWVTESALFVAGTVLFALFAPRGRSLGWGALFFAAVAATTFLCFRWKGTHLAAELVPVYLAGAFSLIFATASTLGSRRGAAPALALVSFVLAFSLPSREHPERNNLPLVEALQKWGAQQSVSAFFTGIQPVFPAVSAAEAQWSLPFASLREVALHYTQEERSAVPFPYRSLEAMADAERGFVASIVGGLVADPPALLLFDRSHQKPFFGLTEFDFEEYLDADPRFRELLRRYRPMLRFAQTFRGRPLSFFFYQLRDP